VLNSAQKCRYRAPAPRHVSADRLIWKALLPRLQIDEYPCTHSTLRRDA
jgi:hypothetical protein